MERITVVDRLRSLRDKSVSDRPTRVMQSVRDAWECIERTRDETVASALAEVLENREDLDLARAVVPALRRGAHTPEGDLQRRLVDGTAALHSLADSNTERTQRDFDGPHYTQEKELLQEAEMYRLGLILYGSEILTDGEVHQLRLWLAECPLEACDGPARTLVGGGPETQDAEKHALREADVHVLRLLLFSSRVLSQREREAVLAWLQQCPVRVKREKVDGRLDHQQASPGV